MDCPCPIVGSTSILPHMVVANKALHENTKVRGPGVEARVIHAHLNVSGPITTMILTSCVCV